MNAIAFYYSPSRRKRNLKALPTKSVSMTSSSSSQQEMTSYPASFGTWVSQSQAAERFGGVTWFHATGLQGETVLWPTRPDATEAIWYNGSGKWYAGSWRKKEKTKHDADDDSGEDEYQWHGFGVYCRKDGRVFVGHWKNGRLAGLVQRLWLPTAECWKSNRADSVIRSRETGRGLPFLYIGTFRGNWKEDKQAIVVLKDGTTRIGPWKRNRPVGDWWCDHDNRVLSQMSLNALLSFGSAQEEDATEETDVSSLEDEEDLVSLSVGSSKTEKQRPMVVDVLAIDPSSNVALDPVSTMLSTSEETTIAHSILNKIVFDGQRLQGQPHQKKCPSPIAIYDREQIENLTHWLSEEVIGHEASVTEMELYARQFADLGLRSVAMICEFCSPGDAACFTWMKEFHRRQLLSWLKTAAVSGSNISDRRCQQLIAISAWLEGGVVGREAGELEVAVYAKSLYDAGFQSVRMIQELCSPQDVVFSFHWMSTPHKRLFLERAGLQLAIE